MAKSTFETMVRELLDYDPSGEEPRLSDWDVDFIEDVSSPRRSDFTGGIIPWTASQRAKLDQIWDRVFGS